MKNNEKIPTNAIGFLWYFMRYYKSLYFSLFFMYLISRNIAVNYILPFIIKYITDTVIQGNISIKIGIFFGFIYAVVYSLEGLYLLISRKYSYKLDSQIERDVRISLFSYVLKHSMSYYNNKMSGIISGKIRNITKNIEKIISDSIIFFSSVIGLLVGVIIYLNINIYLTIVLLLWTIFFSLNTYINLKVIYEKNKKINEEASKLSGIVTDDYSNILNIKSFSKYIYERKLIKLQALKYLNAESKSYLAKSIYNILIFIFMFILFFSVFGIGFYLCLQKQITVGTFLFITQTIILLRFNIDRAFKSSLFLIDEFSGIKEGIETILVPLEVIDKENANELKNVKGKIIFKDVNFSYKL